MDFSVQITQFIDPHFFFFKLLNPFGEKNAEWETELALAVQNDIRGYNAKINEMVAIFVPDWNKWVRGEVDYLMHEIDGTKYIVWCTDYG